LPITENEFERKGNTADNAWLDISVRKHSLTTAFPMTESPFHRSTNSLTKKKRINTAGVLDI